MNFRQQLSFVSVVEYQSFTQAGIMTFTSQPSISSHIRALEAELGVRLLERDTKKISLTQEGKDFYIFAGKVLKLQEQLQRKWQEENTQVLTIGASTLPATYILPQLLRAFRREHPETYFVIHQGSSLEIADGLAQGLFDLALVGMDCSGTADCSPFYQDRLVVITPVEQEFLALQKSVPVPWERLFQHPMILREQGSGTKKRATEFLEALGVEEADLQVAARINDLEAIKQMVANGVGISILSEVAARDFVESNRLLQFSVSDAIAGRSLYLLRPHRQKGNTVLQAFVQKVLQFGCP